MTDLPIIQVLAGDWSCATSPLRSASAPIDVQDPEVDRVVALLRKTLSRVTYGAGLSAVQIGIPVQVAIVNLSRDPLGEIILINPVLLKCSGRLISRSEGCLSLPDYKGHVKRRDKVIVETTSRDGERIVITARGYEAAVLQHELDHMKGMFYWDRMDCGEYPMSIPPAKRD